MLPLLPLQGSSPFASCDGAVQGALAATLAGQLGMPAGRITTACSDESSTSSGGSNGRRQLMQAQAVSVAHVLAVR